VIGKRSIEAWQIRRWLRPRQFHRRSVEPFPSTNGYHVFFIVITIVVIMQYAGCSNGAVFWKLKWKFKIIIRIRRLCFFNQNHPDPDLASRDPSQISLFGRQGFDEIKIRTSNQAKDKKNVSCTSEHFR
jgi:hypothetical protein